MKLEEQIVINLTKQEARLLLDALNYCVSWDTLDSPDQYNLLEDLAKKLNYID